MGGRRKSKERRERIGKRGEEWGGRMKGIVRRRVEKG